jgi:hypothetical protein
VQCVSAYPSSHPVSLNFAPTIFDVPEAQSVIKNRESPLVLALSRSCRLTDILIRSFKIESLILAPVSVSIDCGLFRNRMSPLFANLALLRTKHGQFLHFTVQRDSLVSAPAETPIARFLRFRFYPNMDDTPVQNIVVYGVCEPAAADCVFVDEPPAGDDGVPATVILARDNDRTWRPRETMIPLVLLLRQEMHISGIAIACTLPLALGVGAVSLQFSPPYTEQRLPGGIDVTVREFRCTIMADQIALSSLALIGDPVVPKVTGPTGAAAPPALTRSPSSELQLRLVRAPVERVVAEGEGAVGFRLRLPSDLAICGFHFRGLPDVRTVKARYVTRLREDEVEEFTIGACGGKCNVLLAQRGVMHECILEFTGASAEAFRDLAVKLFGQRR